MGRPVIMGRKTWDSLPPSSARCRAGATSSSRARPLAGGRRRARRLARRGAGAVRRRAEASGSSAAPRSMRRRCRWPTRAVVTEIDADFEGDAFAPAWRPAWQETRARSARLGQRPAPSASSPTNATRQPRRLTCQDTVFTCTARTTTSWSTPRRARTATTATTRRRHDQPDRDVHRDDRHRRRHLRVHGRRHAGQRGPVQEQRGDQEDRSLQPVELLPGQEHQAVAGRDLARPGAGEARQAKYQAKIDRYEKEKNEIKADAEKLEAEPSDWDKQQRRADAPAPPLGAGHHGAAGVHRAGGHRAADAQEVAGVRHVRAWPAIGVVVARWPPCISDRGGGTPAPGRLRRHNAACPGPTQPFDARWPRWSRWLLCLP